MVSGSQTRRKTTNGERGAAPHCSPLSFFMSALEFVGLRESSARAHSGLNKNFAPLRSGTLDLSAFAQSHPPCNGNTRKPGSARKGQPVQPPLPPVTSRMHSHPTVKARVIANLRAGVSSDPTRSSRQSNPRHPSHQIIYVTFSPRANTNPTIRHVTFPPVIMPSSA